MRKKIVTWVRKTASPSLLMFAEALVTKKMFVLPLPYNKNYLRNSRRVKELWGNRQHLTVVDVGSRGAPPPELESIRKVSHYIGFDAASDGQIHSAQHSRDWLSYEVFQVFIGGTDGPVVFNNYTDGGLSSRFEPNHQYDLEFANAYRISSRETVSSQTLATALGERMPTVDILKLDTQGSELEIIDSLRVETLPLVETEVEFIEVYQGQPLFDDVFKSMVSKGYRLLWLTRHFGSPKSSSLLGRGSLVFGEALFGFGPELAKDLSDEKFERFLLALAAYGHCDYAEFMLKSRGGISSEARAELESILQYFSSGIIGKESPLTRVARIFFEKQRYFSGSKRLRHNGMITDSDRALLFR